MILAHFVPDSQRSIQVIGEIPGRFCETGVRRDDDKVVQIQRFDVFAENRQSGEMIDGFFEESLDLRTVKVHGDHPVGPGQFKTLGADPRPDRDARLVFLVPLGVAEVGNDRRD